MDNSIIEELYQIYMNKHIEYAQQEFIQYYKNYQQYGPKNLIKILKDYISSQTPYVANYFVSEKDESYIEHSLTTDMVDAFESIIMPVDFRLGDFLYENDNEPMYADPEAYIDYIKPHDLFNINIRLIDDAIKTYGESYADCYKKVRELIVYVKKHKVLKKIYKDASWHDIPFEEVIYALYDYIGDKSIFKKDSVAYHGMRNSLFGKIKDNCINTLIGSFDKYRPNLNSSKQINANFSKLIFCKNLLLFYETGIMPNRDGHIDFALDEMEQMDLIESFKKLYSKSFDELSFRQNQGNFICVPEVFGDKYCLEAKRKLKQGNKLLFSFLVSCVGPFEYSKANYLIHIQIDDFTNSHSNYEMQVSLIPPTGFNDRIQLMRLDNWENVQPHRNIAKKLATTTHIHLYNEFDLLRGKTNGAFDIAYNISGTSATFETSLKTFLKILDFDAEIEKSIYESIMKSLEKYESDIKDIDI